MSFNPHDPKHDGYKFPSPGAHIFQIVKSECCLSKEKNGPDGRPLPRKRMIEFKFEVVGQDQDKGAEMPWQYFTIQEKSMVFLAEFCRAVHPKVQEFDPLDQAEVTREFMNRHFIGVVHEVEDTWQGRTTMKAKIKSYAYPQAPVIAQIDSMRDPNSTISDAVGGAAAATNGGGWDDDEIPF